MKQFHMVTFNTKNLEDQWVIDAFIMGEQNEYMQYSFTDNKPRVWQTYMSGLTSLQK